MQRQARKLATSLYEVEGVLAVRSADDPLGDFPPKRSMSLLSADAWRRRALKTHRVARNYFFSEVPSYQGRLARLDIVIDGNPFEIETANRVNHLREVLPEKTSDPNRTGTAPSFT